MDEVNAAISVTSRNPVHLSAREPALRKQLSSTHPWPHPREEMGREKERHPIVQLGRDAEMEVGLCV